MKAHFLVRTIFACSFTLILSFPAMASEPVESGTPKDLQHFLNKLVGSWEFSAKAFSPSGELLNEVSNGSATYKWDIEGTIVREEVMSVTSEGNFNGLGIYGYDTVNKNAIYVWFSNIDTGVYSNTGNLDKSGNELIMTGEWPDAETNHNATGWFKVFFVNNNEYQYKLYKKDESGQDYLGSHFIYKRR